jgi:uncharacterized protein (UPF0212 family)
MNFRKCKKCGFSEADVGYTFCPLCGKRLTQM